MPNPPYSVPVSTNYSNWVKHETIYFPISTYYIPFSNRIGADTTFIIKDSSITTANRVYNNCVYAEYDHSFRSFAPSGAGGYTQFQYSFIKPGIGIVYQYIVPYSSQGTAYDRFRFRIFTVRRLVNYKIN